MKFRNVSTLNLPAIAWCAVRRTQVTAARNMIQTHETRVGRPKLQLARAEQSYSARVARKNEPLDERDYSKRFFWSCMHGLLRYSCGSRNTSCRKLLGRRPSGTV